MAVYREKSYICGEYLDVYVYPVYKPPGKRGKKSRPTTDTQAKLNERHSVEKLTRQLHANFTPEDIDFEATYRNGVVPEDSEQAKRDLQNFLARLKRYRDKHGLPPLKYIAAPEKSTKGRYHHHIIMQGDIDAATLHEIWGYGRTEWNHLEFTENGLERLAKYVTKSPLYKKRVFKSKNLIDPEPRTNDYRIRSRRKAAALAKDPEDREPWEKLYPDYHLAKAVPFHNDDNGGVYIFARLYRRDGRFIPPVRIRPKKKVVETMQDDGKGVING